MLYKRFLEVVEEALELPPGSVEASDRLADVEAWDSIGALSVIAAINKEFGVVLDAEAFDQCETLGDMAQLVTKGQ